MLKHLQTIRKRTTGKLHARLRERWRWYDLWHRHPAHKHVHIGILAVYLFAVVVATAASFYPKTARAATDYTITSNSTWCDADDVPSDIGNLTINDGVVVYLGKTSGNAVNGYKAGSPSDPCSFDSGGITLSGTGTLTVNGTLYIAGESTTDSDGVGHTLDFPNVTVSSTGTISAYAFGYPEASGPGKGSYSTCGSGGGHGGAGGSGSGACGYSPSGGNSYGDSQNPVTLGSGGGNYLAGESKGGGAIKIESLDGTVTVNSGGSIVADGQPGFNVNAGGGAGGSILINAGVIAGSGTISANGGSAANSNGGAGGGGRVALHYVTSNSISSPSVAGGTVGYGGASGTVNITSVPAAPSLAAPADASGASTTGVEFTFSATNADGNNLKYEIQIDDDSAFGSVFEDGDQTSSQTGFSNQDADSGTSYASGSTATYTLQGTLTVNTTYYWRVRSKAPAGSNTWSEWSSARSIIINDPPQVSLTNSPSQDANGDIAIAYNLCDTNHSTLTVNVQYTTDGSNYVSAQSAALSGSNSYGTVTGVSNNCASPDSKSVTFDPSADSNISASYYSQASGSFKVRVQAVDGIANGTVNSTPSSAFEMDNAPPATPVNSSPANAAVTNDTTPTLTASSYSDDTSISAARWQVDDTSSAFASLVVDETVTSSPSNSYTLTTNLLDGTTYYFRVRYKDGKGNWSSWSSGTSVTIDTSAPSQASLTVFDTSSAANSNYEHYLWWTTSNDPNFANYKILRSTNGVDYSVVSTISDSSQNYYLDKNLSDATTYYYKITVNDAAGNSSTSDVSSNKPASADTNPPSISAVSSGSVGTNSAVITWTTDESANSIVDYGTDTNYGSSFGNAADSVTSHTVTISGLNAGTTYYYRIRSADSSDNMTTDDNNGSGYTFTTSSAPAISNVSAGTASQTSVTITWTTSTASNSIVDYGTTNSYGTSIGDVTASSTSHSVTINGLSSGTTYYYRVKSTDSGGNQTADDNNGSGYTFTTGTDETAPTISAVSSSNVTNSQALISWTTDEAATGTVSYSTSSGFTWDSGTTVAGASEANNQTHKVQLTGLTRNTTYYYKVRSTDGSGNSATSSESYFTTSGDATGPVISSAGVSSVAQTTAVVTWVTDEPATSSVALGAQPNSYSLSGGSNDKLDRNHRIELSDLSAGTVYYLQIVSTDENSNSTTKNYSDDSSLTFTTQITPNVSSVSVSEVTASTATISWKSNVAGDSYVEFGKTADYGSKQGSDADTVSHEITLVGLDPATTYHFRARTSDINGNLALSADTAFTTESLAEADSTAPSISDVGPNVSATADSAVITWTTDEAASSSVQFGKTSDLGEETGIDESVVSHSITLKALDSATTYYYRVRSKDGAGNLAQSEIKTFATKAKSEISEVQISDITLNSAIVTWKTSRATSSVLNYGTTADYGSSVTDQSLGSTTKHTVKLNDLQSGAVYHFEIKGTDDDGKTVESDDYVFNTQTLPLISKVAVSDIQANKVTISWTTNTKTDASVSYGKKGIGEHKQGSDAKGTAHSVTLIGLDGQTKYFFAAQSRDDFGNSAVSGVLSFTTKKDIYPPEINDVKSEISTVGRGNTSRIQVIVSWSTDEASTSLVEYGTGVSGGELGSKSRADKTFNQSHIVVLRDLLPATTYRFRVVSEDKAGNSARSSDFTILTPDKEESALQIIVKSLEETFGFLGNVRGLLNR